MNPQQKARIVLDITTSIAHQFGVPNKYTRVEAYLAPIVVARRGLLVRATLDGGAFATSEMPTVARGLYAFMQIVNSTARRRLPDLARMLLLMSKFAKSRIIARKASLSRAHDLLWHLSQSYELITPGLRRSILEHTDALRDHKLARDLDHWLTEREMLTEWMPQRKGTSKNALQKNDLLVLAGASWCHIDFNALRREKARNGFRVACFIYDVLPIVYPSLVKCDERRQFRSFVDGALAVGDVIVVPSAQVADDLRRGAAYAFPPMIILPLYAAALSPADSADPARLQCLSGRPFAFCLSRFVARKHVLWLLELWQAVYGGEADPPLLVLAGHVANWATPDQLHREPFWLHCGILLRDPSDDELRWLYGNAGCLLHPSFEGGLGMPLMEARVFGTRCIAADVPSLVEASGGGATHLPKDLSRWKEAVRQAFMRPAPCPTALTKPDSDMLDLIEKACERVINSETKF